MFFYYKMKAWKTVIFIFTVLAALAIICAVFPKDGITIGNVTFEFPSLTEALTPASASNQPAEEEVDEEVQQQLDALHTAKQKEFDEFCKNSPTRIYMPKNDMTYLDAFFEALDTANKKSVRIIHYGDSQLEGDRMSSAIREHFQTTFGGCGVGMVPAVQPIGTYTLSQTVSPALRRYCAFGSSDFRANHNRYGPLAAMSRLDGSATFTFTPRGAEKFPHAQKFQRISVAMRGSGSMRVSALDSTFELKAKTTTDTCLRIFSVTLPRPADKATLSVSGSMDLYGIMLDGKNGVSMDNVPMRGCSGTIFTNIAKNSVAPYFKEENVGLIILQYGGNSVPYLNGAKGIEIYKNQIKKQIAHFRQMAPKARILFIGPSDMSTRIGGVLQTYPHLPEVITALREAANEEGAAFWDMYSAQGGHNSMVQWVNARPQLAGGDYIHFTPLGAEKMSQILYDTFQLYYKFYRFRTGKDPVEIEEPKPAAKDSVSKKNTH